MSSGLKNSILILALAILLPVSIFTVVEVASLNENEKILEKVYREQLDGIIFTINQYGADLFDFYVHQMDYTYAQGGIKALKQPEAIKGNLAIEFIVLKENGQAEVIELNKRVKPLNLNMDSIFLDNVRLIERLIRYKEEDYIKQEILGNVILEDETLQINLIIIGEKTPCLIFLDPIIFIEDLLAPKIQQITTQLINVSIEDTLSSQSVYQSEEAPNGIIQSALLSKTPSCQINVSLHTQSVTDLIGYRTKRNLIALGGMVGIIILGMILIIRNLRKEMLLNKAKADFVANVSHEIRTPLSLISMFNETLLLGRVKEEKKSEYYEIISKETARLKNIVNKILSFSQIDADKKIYKPILINPDQKVEEIIRSYSYHLKEKGFDYQISLEANTTVNADEEAFAEVIINLIDNAVKYSTNTKFVRISSSISDGKYCLSVLDKGVGIDPKYQTSVFDKFYRIEGGDVHNTKGTGLGLSLVSEIVKAHNGEITLKSKKNEGSTFIIKFPIA